MPQHFPQLPSRFTGVSSQRTAKDSYSFRAIRVQKNKRPPTQPLFGYDKEAHRKVLSPDAIPVKKPVYFTQGSWEGTENRNTSGGIKKRQLCSKSYPYTNAMKGIEEVDELTKLHEKSDKTSEEEKRIVTLLKSIKSRMIDLVIL
ncbi:hypothetical protein QE152_g40749 [Popillia japonica]|uniref:Uncharacterized protein n=1 Tax=Popillia japonica TaxID=7064 RepID=A0AAW1HFI4_POPJA